ncbi:MAG: 50S ribosome-binding GTPase [Candidatus Lokiarchaeota archaeon]|nr:50S ribosome-binding GTPase [Candidatus Lokiarchaeota archaeon]
MEKKISKTLIMGLRNSGKSSILEYFQGIRNLVLFGNIKPTVHIDRVIYQAVDYEHLIWDFGGQIDYLSDYLEQFYEYAYEADEIIYVIDIQDQEKYNPSINFLKKIIKLLVDKELYIDIKVFLHKFDPDLDHTHPEINEEVIINLLKDVKNIFSDNISYSIFKTSLYVDFKKYQIIG